MRALWVAIAVVLDGAAALVGGLLPEAWLVRHRPEMLGFAAGALLSASALDILPEALADRGLGALPWMLGGILALALVEWLMSGQREPAAVGLLGADALHNFSDGMAIAAAFIASTKLGIITSAAVIVHEVPEEVADYAILRKFRYSKGRALVWLAVVQMTAGLGALVALLGASFGGMNGVVLAIAGGTFLYIATVDILPEVLRGGTRRSHVAALVGLVLGVIVVAVIP